MNKQLTKFTVIIPTRCRPDTLKWSLKSCVEQNYENLEIIVCDNYSQDNTFDVVNSYQDSRIKYINPGRRLSMSNNWEFALQHATGDYINYIGDDDAMLPRAFIRLNEILQELKCDALSWLKDDFVYSWSQTENPNLLSISLWGSRGVRLINSRNLLESIQSFKAGYTLLPMIYSSTIKKSVLQRITSYRGSFFNAASPDVDSGVVIACELESFFRSGTPYSMTGYSKYSIGASNLSNQPVNTQPGMEFYQENSHLPHRQIGADPVNLAMCVADSILIARDTIPRTDYLKIDFADLMSIIAKDSISLSPEKYLVSVSAIRKIGVLNSLESTAEKIIRKFPNQRTIPKPNNLLARANSIGTIAYLNCTDFGIDNVYDASVLTYHILSLQGTGCLLLRDKINSFVLSLFGKGTKSSK
jgi:glycosyltransferase involved in cell wall biosynthesis